VNELFGMCATPPLRLRIIAYDFHTHPVVYKRSVRCPSGNHDFYPIAHILFKGHDIDWTFGFSPNVHFLGNCAAEINGIRFDGMP